MPGRTPHALGFPEFTNEVQHLAMVLAHLPGHRQAWESTLTTSPLRMTEKENVAKVSCKGIRGVEKSKARDLS